MHHEVKAMRYYRLIELDDYLECGYEHYSIIVFRNGFIFKMNLN